MFGYADTAAVLIGHGSSLHVSAAECLSEHAEKLRAYKIFTDTGYATLNGGPSPEEALTKFDDVKRILVLPYFMTDGYLSRLATTSRLGIHQNDPRITVCPPIGKCPQLVVLAADIAEECRTLNGWIKNAWDLLLVAHGASKDPASKRETEKIAQQLSSRTSAADILVSFIEEAPFIHDVARKLKRPTVVVGLFAAPGGHALDDVPEALAEAHVPVHYSGAVGDDPRMVDAIIATLKAGMQEATVAN